SDPGRRDTPTGLARGSAGRRVALYSPDVSDYKKDGDMKYEIQHTVMQCLEVHLAQGEALVTQAGGMAWMSDGVDMNTGAKGGVMGALGRMMAGSSIMLTTYKSNVPDGMVTFVTDGPGKILPFQLAAGQSLIAQRDTFLVAQEGVTMEAVFTKKLGAGMFGG